MKYIWFIMQYLRASCISSGRRRHLNWTKIVVFSCSCIIKSFKPSSRNYAQLQVQSNLASISLYTIYSIALVVLLSVQQKSTIIRVIQLSAIVTSNLNLGATYYRSLFISRIKEAYLIHLIYLLSIIILCIYTTLLDYPIGFRYLQSRKEIYLIKNKLIK